MQDDDEVERARDLLGMGPGIETITDWSIVAADDGMRLVGRVGNGERLAWMVTAPVTRYEPGVRAECPDGRVFRFGLSWPATERLPPEAQAMVDAVMQDGGGSV